MRTFSAPPALALGTVQFGMNYGVVGRGEVVPLNEVRDILAYAEEIGILTLDTAPVYGEIESNLRRLLNNKSFQVISKIPSLPAGVDIDTARQLILDSIKATQQSLDDVLTRLLFHSADDLLGVYGEAIWEVALQATSGTDIMLGVSCYSPDELLKIQQKYGVRVAQLPGNALDQRLNTYTHEFENIEIYLRSVFLQGLLLYEAADLNLILSRSMQIALSRWRAWCADQKISLIEGALSAVKCLPGVHYCTVGVDSLAQLKEIHACWERVDILDKLPLAVDDLAVIDPRYWSRHTLETESGT